MKKIISLMLVVAVIISSLCTFSVAASGIKIQINGQNKVFDVMPQIVDGRTLVPMRGIFEEFGADIHWDEKTRTVKKHIDRLKASVSFQSFLNLGLGKPHVLTENLAGHYAVSVSGNLRLIIKPDCDDLSVSSLKNCNIVIVKGIGDYHGGKIEWLIP